MFHHTYPRISPSVDPRAKYLAAVAEAKAAEAEFLAAEAAQRQYRRLQDIHPAENSFLRSTHGLGDIISPSDAYGDRHAYYGQDNLASIRRQIEEEERRQLEEKRLLVALQTEIARESRRRQEEERARLALAFEKGKHAAHLRERLARAVQVSHQQEPHAFVHERAPFYGADHVKQVEEVALHPFLQAILGNEAKVIPGSLVIPSREPTTEMTLPAALERFVGSGRQDAIPPVACNRTQPAPAVHIPSENIQQALSLLFGGSQSVKHAQAHPIHHHDVTSLEKQLELIFGAATQKQPPQAPITATKATETAKASSCPAVTSRLPEAENLQQFMNLLLGGHQKQGSPSSSSSEAAASARHAHPEGLRQLLNLLGGQRQQQSATCSKTQAPQPSSSQSAPEGIQQIVDLLGGQRQQQSAACSKTQAPQPSSSQAAPEGIQQILDLFMGGGQQQQPAASSKTQGLQPSSSQAAPEGLRQIFDLMGGGQQQQQSTTSSKTQAPQPSSSQVAPGLQQILDLFMGGGQQQQQSATSSKTQLEAPRPSSSQAVPEGVQQILDLFMGGHQHQQQSAASLKAQASQSSSSQEAEPGAHQPHPEGVQQFLNLFRGQQQHAPQPPPSSKEQQTQPEPAAEAPKLATSAERSLKAELESRLNNEYEAEVRDTIQAIFASLVDSGASAAPGPTSTPAPASSSPSGSGKGKGKASEILPSTHSAGNATSKDVIDSLNQVHNIEAAFSALESEFSFPSQLDFLDSHLTSDTSTSSDPATSHLAHTSRNYPVRFYEQSLGSLLSQLDSVESYGNEELRMKRKHVVDKVEKVLEELESEVEGRWRTKVTKETKSFRVTIRDAPSAAAEVPAGSVQQEADQARASDAGVVLGTEEAVENPTVSSSTPDDAAPGAGSKTEDAIESLAAPTAAPAAIPAEVSSETPALTFDSPVAPEEGIAVPLEMSLTDATPPVPSQAAETTDIDTNDPSLSASASLAESAATLRLIDEVAPSPESVDTFLLPAHPPALDDSSMAKKRSHNSEHDVDAGSDWSEIEG